MNLHSMRINYVSCNNSEHIGKINKNITKMTYQLTVWTNLHTTCCPPPSYSQDPQHKKTSKNLKWTPDVTVELKE